mgnify:CR=1 FL=1
MEKLIFGLAAALALAVVFLPGAFNAYAEDVELSSVPRISPEAARTAMTDGKALMVCAYEDNRCRKMLIQGAMLKSEFQAKASELPKSRLIIFYCN